MSEDYIIAIVTRGRTEKQICLESMPVLIRKLVTIFCHPGEKQRHQERWKGKVANIIEYGKKCQNIGQARDWVMDYCIDHNIRYVIQIDDNVLFASRVDKSGNVDFKNRLLNLRNNFSEDTQVLIYTDMFSWMLKSLRSGYGIVGISHRSGNNRKKDGIEENARLFAVWGISTKKYVKVGARFSDNPYKEDFHMQLAFLTNGIKTVCNNCFTFDKARGANQDGGCSIYRDLDNVNRGSELLKKYYPDFVSLVEKDSNNWSNLGNCSENIKRKEVIVQWKKAYKKL